MDELSRHGSKVPRNKPARNPTPPSSTTQADAGNLNGTEQRVQPARRESRHYLHEQGLLPCHGMMVSCSLN